MLKPVHGGQISSGPHSQSNAFPAQKRCDRETRALSTWHVRPAVPVCDRSVPGPARGNPTRPATEQIGKLSSTPSTSPQMDSGVWSASGTATTSAMRFRRARNQQQVLHHACDRPLASAPKTPGTRLVSPTSAEWEVVANNSSASHGRRWSRNPKMCVNRRRFGSIEAW